MIKILIIEDEIPARKKLKRFIEELEIETLVVAEIDTVETAINFLQTTNVDLIFSDIELLDGNVFEVYKEVAVSCPIIFSTAYDNFWMNAFEVNGIDYLLKPFSKERFMKAWDKFILLRNTSPTENNLLTDLSKFLEQNFKEKQYKKRFSVHTNQGIYFLDTESIVFFEAKEGVVFAFDTMGKKHLLKESTLHEIVELLDAAVFFRINRSELINKNHIQKIERYSKNALAIKVTGLDNYLKTSQSNTAAFNDWIEQ